MDSNKHYQRPRGLSQKLSFQPLFSCKLTCGLGVLKMI